jgi:nitronate monooxygenase
MDVLAGSSALLARLGVAMPVLQAPMAGVGTAALAAAVSNAGALGGLAVGAMDAAAAREAIAATRSLTQRPFNVNLFCHRPALRRAAVEQSWIAYLRPWFERFDVEPPVALREIYKSFVNDDDMLDMLLETRPAVVSLHFGLPPPAKIDALRKAGIALLASATNLDEARRIALAGLDGVVAQGIEAGGHRGVFDPHACDPELGTMALTRLLARDLPLPVIAAGGIMDGAGIAAALSLGAAAAQLGTAFIACPESAADAAYRTALLAGPEVRTVMTRAISGRPARSLANRFTELGADPALPALPDYPVAYDAGKALHAAAKACGESGYGAQWAGQGAGLARALPAAALVAALQAEMRATLGAARDAPA